MKNKNIITIGLGLIMLMPFGSMAQSSCDVIIPSGQYLVDGEQLNLIAGNTVCLAAGERGPLKIKNVVGSEQAPIIITNESEPVITTPFEYSIAIENSSYVNLIGRSALEHSPYSIQLGGTLSIGQLSHHIHVENIEVYRARFAGMLIKTDPTCDPATWRENFVMSGITIKNNYVHHTEEGEGMYIGYTGLSRTLPCNGIATTVYPHYMESVVIENNRLEYLAADGIQLNSVIGNSRIHNNTIYRTGVSPFAPHWQNTGIQVGGDHVTVSHNHIYKSGGNGMMLDGDSLTILNNIIVEAGENGIFARNAAQQNASVNGGEPHHYQGNTFIASGDYAIKLYAVNTASEHLIQNNTIETDGSLDAASRPKTFSFLNQNVLRKVENNRYYIEAEH